MWNLWQEYPGGTTTFLRADRAWAVPPAPANIVSGTYTPTLTNFANVSSSVAYPCQYMRVGNVITVSGRIDIIPIASGLIELGISVPIASNFSNFHEAGGMIGAINYAESGAILARPSTGVVYAQWPVVVSAVTLYMGFSFTYQVI